MPSPRYSYHLTEPGSPHAILAGPAHRIIEVNNRRGVNFTSIRGRIALPEHTM